MNIFYPGDCYHTPENVKKPLFPSLAFYRKVVGVVVADGLKAKNNPYSGDDWADASHRVFKALESVGVRLHVTGMDAMDRLDGRPCVFIGNHMSTLETFILPCLIQPRMDTTFVVKQSLVDYPVFKHVLRSREPIVVGRANPREDLQAVLEGGEERLKNGRSVIIFPQSTRSRNFDPEHFNTIGIKLARRAKVPVIPIALKTDAWGTGSLVKDFGPVSPSMPVHIAFAEPFMVQGNGKEDHAAIVDFITTNLERWKQEDAASRA